VVKIPRWDLTKFVGVSKNLGSSMKSVGEIMAIGRSFEEAIQKGIRMVGLGMHGFVANKEEIYIEGIDDELSNPTDRRIFAIAEAFGKNYTIDQIHDKTKIDRWFLQKLKNIFNIKNELEKFDTLEDLPVNLLKMSKQTGFSDFQIARLVLKYSSKNIHEGLLKVRNHRKAIGIVPYVKQIDTLAGEYPAQTNYLYITYNGSEHDIEFNNDDKSVIVLGSGAYRIGSSVEFDWCSVNAVNTIHKEGYRSIMINYNPETVSTDYDTCDRLYFDELSFERVMDIVDLENPHGVVVSMGGQIPNNLAMKLHGQNVPVLGTSPLKIDNAEDREKFSSLLDTLKIDQPRWARLSTIEEIHKFVDIVGYPLLIRPSYVLSGAAMNVVSNPDQLVHFLEMAADVSKEHPVVVSEFIEDAKEIEIDAVANKGEMIAYAISEHVEFAGVHSGDATIVFPPQKLYIETIRRVKKIAREIAKGLEITGPFNIQFLAKDNDIKVIECNLRASRSFPFVSKVMKLNLIEIATKVMLGIDVEKPDKSLFELDYVGVKAPQFSFARLLNADPVLGVDMASTGEVGCIGENYYEAILKAMLSVGYRIPVKNVLISSGPSRGKIELLTSAKMMRDRGYNIFATEGTHRFFTENGVENTLLYWPDEENQSPNTIEYIKEKKIDLVINIPKNYTSRELKNDYTIRRSAIDYNIPLITNSRVASAFIYAICKYEIEDISIKSWDEYN
jgi:carbamoyl-phosphate synthase large subunit